jgi:ABC-2 type transport system permease protein
MAVFIFAIASGVYPAWTWLELPLIIAILAAFAIGLGLLLSSLFVRYRDVQPIWEVALQILFYASPIIYTTETYPDSIEHQALVNPIAAVLAQMRHALVDPDAPTAAAAIGGGVRLLIPLGLTLAVFALGAWVFTREAPRIAEDL